MGPSSIPVEAVAENFGVFTGAAPVFRLSSETRRLAMRYVSGDIGRSLKPAAFAMPPGALEG